MADSPFFTADGAFNSRKGGDDSPFSATLVRMSPVSPMGTFHPAKQLLTCAFACALLVSCGFFSPRNINLIKNESSLRLVIQPDGYNYDDAKIRTAVLQQITLGASRQQIEAFLKRNFTGVAYSISTKSVPGAGTPSTHPCVFVRPIEVSNSSGGEHVDIYLLLDTSEHLTEVVVKSNRSYL